MDHSNTETQQFVDESYPVATGIPIYGQTPSNTGYPIQTNPYYPNYAIPNPSVGISQPVQRNPMMNVYLPQIRDNVNKNIITTKDKQITLKVPNCLSNLYDKVMERKGPKESINAHCPNCGQDGMTKMESKIGAGNLACTGLLCCCCQPLCLCPLLIDECYDHQHTCQHCGTVITKEKFLL